MLNRKVSGLMLTLLLMSMSMLAFNIPQVKASGTIYIKADGSVDPPTAPISSLDNVTYTFWKDIFDSIVIERDNIVVDGAGYNLQGTGALGSEGITLSRRSNVTIKNMTIKSFSQGVLLTSSSNNSITGNNVTKNGYGIVLGQSSNNSISGNNVTASNWHGIQLYASSNYNRLSENNLTSNWHGISLEWSSNNMLRHNRMVNNEVNFWLDGLSLLHFENDIDASNTVDGKPIYYWINKQNVAVPLDAGYVALVNCKRVTAQNLNLIKNGQGLLLAATANSAIIKNNIANNVHGIRLLESLNNSIVGNNITANTGNGVWLYNSLNNNVAGNNITANNAYGMVFVGESSSNYIYHNNYVNNTVQVSSLNLENIWDYGYPSGGNYWSNYNGFDFYTGSFQNETGGDGIGDAPYAIDEDNQDRYPFMKPWTSTPDINNDGVVNTSDIIIWANAFGSQPGDPNWNPPADLYQDGIIDIFDGVKISTNFGKTYP